MATIQAEAKTMAVNHPKKAAGGDAKLKKAKAKKASSHPPFYEMVSDAILTLKERSGSSQYAIQKFAEEKHKQLPVNFRKQLLTQLKKFVASGKLVKVKNSYKLPAGKAAPATKPKATTTAAKKPTLKKAVSKATKAVTKPKAKTVAKPKSAAAKPKAVAGKRKAVKPKAKPAKVAKKSAASSPSKKKVASAAKTVKKVAAQVKKAGAKKVKKLSSVKSPAKRSSARKGAK